MSSQRQWHRIRQLQARVDALERENRWLRQENAGLYWGRRGLIRRVLDRLAGKGGRSGMEERSAHDGMYPAG